MGTKSFTWITTALVSGVAASQALAGALVEYAEWRSAALPRGVWRHRRRAAARAPFEPRGEPAA